MLSFFRSLFGSCHIGTHFLGDFFRVWGGVWKLSKLNDPIVSVFGGSKMAQDHPYAAQAHKLAEMLMSKGISVITGGGPGIMEAANCGAFKQKDRKARSVGITVHGLAAEQQNPCADDHIATHYFFARKFLLTYRSTAFAIFPGGYGTADELFQVLTLMQTNKLCRGPVVLIDKDFWKPLVEWIETSRKEGLLLQEDADLIFLTDDVNEAFEILQRGCQKTLK